MTDEQDPELLLQHAPLLQQGMSTPGVMRDVVYALLPAALAGVWYFGLAALLVLLASILGACVTEWTFSGKPRRVDSLYDASALVTGLLLGMTLPPGLPLWMAFLGGVVGIGFGKVIWGGLGLNLFNPALVGRAFLLATFPIAMTTWNPASPDTGFLTVHATNLALPFMHLEPDGVTAATPLGLLKFQHETTSLVNLLIGNRAGSIGEASGLLLLLGGAYLWWRRDLDWRIPASILATVAVFSFILSQFDNPAYPTPLFSLFSGGLMLGALFMATDPVTSPITPRGSLIFGVGIGVLVVLIRVFGGLPEGVMYAILLMNGATPLINRFTQPRVFGRGRELT